MAGERQMAASQWSDQSGQESGSAGDGKVGVGVGTLRVHLSKARGDCPAPVGGVEGPFQAVEIHLLVINYLCLLVLNHDNPQPGKSSLHWD